MRPAKRTERGWAGHFICAMRCKFRRNTLIEYKNKKIVVSTVGLMENPLEEGKYDEIGYKRYYETMAFKANLKDKKYYDADVSQPIQFNSNWTIDNIDDDNQANDMHEKVVKELMTTIKETK
tara:strand:+ start:119 stop:484 length:366 start_codon:yes stop_codon:yes gene_type:complete